MYCLNFDLECLNKLPCVISHRPHKKNIITINPDYGCQPSYYMHDYFIKLSPIVRALGHRHHDEFSLVYWSIIG